VIFISCVSLRATEEEKRLEKLEDEYDLRTVSEYEKEKASKFHTMFEAIKELGLENEIRQ